jgi:hypothetical protein
MSRILLVALMFVPFLLTCNSNRIPGDWDCYEEMNTDMAIGDDGGCGIGVGLSNGPPRIIDSIAINVVLTHEKPSNMDIWVIHGADTLMLWDNDYPGGTQALSIDTLIGQKANVDWMFYFCDSVTDGNEGRLRQVTLMMRYR